MFVSAGPILAETEKPKVLSQFFWSRTALKSWNRTKIGTEGYPKLVFFANFCQFSVNHKYIISTGIHKVDIFEDK